MVKENKTDMLLICIVGIVAIVGIIIIISNQNNNKFLNDDSTGKAYNKVISSDNIELSNFKEDAQINQEKNIDSKIILIQQGNKQIIEQVYPKEGEVFSVVTGKDFYAITSNKGYEKYEGFKKTYKKDNSLDIELIGYEGLDVQYYDIYYLVYERDTPPGGQPYNIGWLQDVSPGVYPIIIPEGDVDIYFGITTRSYDSLTDMSTFHFFYYSADNSAGYVVIDLNQLKEMNHNFEEIAKIQQLEYFRSIDNFAIFDKNLRNFLQVVGVIGNLHIKYYGPEQMTSVKPVIGFKNYPIQDKGETYTILTGDFYPDAYGRTDIYVKLDDLRKLKSYVDTSSHFFEEYLDVSNLGYCFKQDNLTKEWQNYLCVANGERVYYPPVNIYYIKDQLLWYGRYYLEPMTYAWYFQQLKIFGELEPIPEQLTFLKGPLTGVVMIDNQYVEFYLKDSDPDTPIIKNMPNTVIIDLIIPSGEILQGRGTFSINCNNLQNSNPPIVSCDPGFYNITIDLSEVVLNGDRVFRKNLYYDGNSWSQLK